MRSLIFMFYFLFLFAGKREPKFETQVIDTNISIGYGIALGDVDGDKKPDILLADKKQFVWYRNGDWKRFVMAENLTANDNVCIAARDINNDGKVEVAVGAQWNPGETLNAEQSGSVHFLMPPDDPTQLWKAVKLYHEPTIHRMRWVQSPGGKHYLAVLPLHGSGNKGGEGKGVNILFYAYPELINAALPGYIIPSNMHMTHNFDVVESNDVAKAGLYIAGKEGIRIIHPGNDKLFTKVPEQINGINAGAGEVKVGKMTGKDFFLTTIEQMHGNQLVIYRQNKERVVLDSNLKEGHALACHDFLNTGNDQVVAGWRMPNKEGKVGVKIYVRKDAGGNEWESHWIDDDMACEDIQVIDLNGDGKKDIIASGRATHNLKIYWNKSGKN